jgi:hypothetical protein
VQATAWYIEGGSGPGSPALLIDAFDVDIGDFVLDDFVNVVTDSSLTAEANLDGIVSTTEASEDVRAYTSIRSVPFNQWLIIEGMESVSAEDLTGAQNTSAIAFAMYQSHGTGPTRVPSNIADATWVSWGVMVDGGGPTGRGPVPPWNPFIRELAVGLAIAEAAPTVDSSLQGELLRIASAQVKLAAENIVGNMNGAAGGSG